MARVLTVGVLVAEMRRRLLACYIPSEVQWMIRIALEHLKGWTLADIAMHSDSEATEWLQSRIADVTERLLRHEPLQYILGCARFYGLNFKVTDATLIPRPETEQLVDLAVKKAACRTDLRILDLCTGSGCIALALARNIPFCKVVGVDVSGEALAVARENAAALKVDVSFERADVLTMAISEQDRYDIITANPPYILPSERKDMASSVTDYEPGTALFVSESDPLEFHRTIAGYAAGALLEGGSLIMEINPLLAKQTLEVVHDAGFADGELLRDERSRQRFILATKSRS